MALAPTQYVRSGDADIAYQVIGDGPRDIVLVFDWASHLGEIGDQPVNFVQGCAASGACCGSTCEGWGMSSAVAGGVIPVETWMDDLVAVLDAAGSSEVTIVALVPEAAERAALLRGRSKTLMLADALVLGYAETAGAGVVLTTDRRLSRLSPRVRLVG